MNLKKYAGTLILFAFFFLCQNPSSAETLIQGSIPSGTWTEEGNPYYITNFTEIPIGNKLDIQPGVEIYTYPGIPFDVRGTLICNGTEEKPILFGSQNIFHQWDGIRVLDGGSAYMRYTIVERAGTVRPDELHGGGISVLFSFIKMEYCTIRFNSSTLDGAGMYIRYSDYDIRHCSFHNNIAGRCGAVLSLAEGGEGTFSYNLIFNNYAEADAAIYIYYGKRKIDHCTFFNNMSKELAGDIRIYGVAEAIVTNSIFWHDVNRFDESVNNEGGTLTMKYCCTDDKNISHETIIKSDPLFVEPISYDFHLLPQSPCINSGDPAFPTDSDSTITDMGAFPYKTQE